MAVEAWMWWTRPNSGGRCMGRTPGHGRVAVLNEEACMATNKASAAKKTAPAKKTPPAKTPAPAKKASKASKQPAGQIRSWQDDPGSPDAALQPVQSAAPNLGSGSLPVSIDGMAPPAAPYSPGTPEFRYWAAAEALGRVTKLWSGLLPSGTRWVSTNGPSLPVALDDGEDFNAYYDRHGLHFFHGTSGGRLVFSGESPDVVCHETGHAVLDALQPQLWGAAFIEGAAFHESFGDMSALLSALQLQSVREAVLVETGGQLYRSSRLSRLAEQLGWAIRQFRPDVVDPDCLRNAVNSFFYQDPHHLPPSGPASALSSEPHSFSRVFTASFLESLAGIHQAQAQHDQAALAKAANDAAALLLDAIIACPVVPSYYSQIAAHMMSADATRFGGRYTPALKAAFVKHGILSLESANSVTASPAGSLPAKTLAAATEEMAVDPMIALPGERYGLSEVLLVSAPAEPKRFSVASAAPDTGPVEPPAQDRAARSFVEDLFRRGNVAVEERATVADQAIRPSHLTHSARRLPEGLTLVRELFDCGYRMHHR